MATQMQLAGVKFGDVARDLADKDPQVRLQMRKGSDLLIGFASAESQPSTPKAGRIRKDFYDAFTLLDQPQLYYHPDLDEITQSADESSVPVPRQLREEAIALRSEFITQLPAGETRERLTAAITGGNDFSQFSRIIVAGRLSDLWRAFNFKRLNVLITNWATAHSLMIQKDWFNQESAQRLKGIIRHPLRDMFESMTEDELEQVFIPAKLTAAMLARRLKMI